ncbi:MAG: polysaccharide deacetylase family protein [Bacteroidota bacterium]
MKGFLTQNQVEYVFFHLNHSCTLTSDVRQKIVCKRENVEEGDGKIIFQLTDESLSRDKIRWEDQIPLLFPSPEKSGFYEMQGNNLLFHHDLLKSSFYLLSGYQELKPGKLDSLGRYAYEESIQKSLGIMGRPVVNYYFSIVIQGISEFCKLHGIPFQKHSIFRNFAFFLTHDVDSLDTYTLNEAGYRVKQVLGLAPSTESKARTARIALRYLVQSMNGFNRKNPSWDFEFLRQAEEKHGFKSAFFFLPKDQLHVDAYYSFNEPRVRKLFKSLKEQGCELGIHGTVRSSTSPEALTAEIKELEKHVDQPIHGIRQHRLMFDRSLTHAIHHQAGLLYDSSLAYADHEGFRNSYCLPFRPYDHEKDGMYDTWEIPLTVMDVTLFDYRKLSFPQALDSVRDLLEEVNKFKGVFVLLWHNGQNDEFLLPGITDFYMEVMRTIAEREPENLLGPEIIKRLDNEKHE